LLALSGDRQIAEASQFAAAKKAGVTEIVEQHIGDVIAPEYLAVDGKRGYPEYARGDRFVGVCAQLLFDRRIVNPRLPVVDAEIFWGDDVTDMLLDYLGDPGLFRRGELGRLGNLPVAAQRKQSRL
jgi:hypothetical protein